MLPSGAQPPILRPNVLVTSLITTFISLSVVLSLYSLERRRIRRGW